MKMKKGFNVVAIVVGAVIVIIIGSMIFGTVKAFSGGYNRQIVDWTYKYDMVQIEMPDGSIVSGTVESWTDFEDGDQIQVTVNGKTYLTDTTRCVMWRE